MWAVQHENGTQQILRHLFKYMGQNWTGVRDLMTLGPDGEDFETFSVMCVWPNVGVRGAHLLPGMPDLPAFGV